LILTGAFAVKAFSFPIARRVAISLQWRFA
jgi:hypothetical protein